MFFLKVKIEQNAIAAEKGRQIVKLRAQNEKTSQQQYQEIMEKFVILM